MYVSFRFHHYEITFFRGARHGLRLNGKLSRIEKQDKLLMKHYNKSLFNKVNKTKTDQRSKDQQIRDILSKIKKLTVLVTVLMGSSKTDIKFDESLAIIDKSLKTAKKIKKLNQNTLSSKPETLEYSNNQDLQIEMDNKEVKHNKRKRKSTNEESNNVVKENQIEEETARKRTECFCDAKNRKQLKIKRRKEAKQFKKISQMLENVNLDKEPKSDDDGFEEGTMEKKRKIEKDKKKKKKKKCKKLLNNDTNEDHYVKMLSDIREKLACSIELRKSLTEEKRKSEDIRIRKISEDLNKLCTM